MRFMFETGLRGVEGKPVSLGKLPRRSLSNKSKRGQELIIDIISVLVTLFANSFGLFRRVWCLGIRAGQ